MWIDLYARGHMFGDVYVSMCMIMCACVWICILVLSVWMYRCTRGYV